MKTQKRIEATKDIKVSVGDLRRLLSNRPEVRDKIRFKRYGKRYVVTNNNNNIAQQLENSFNSFMNKLEVKPDGELRGVCFLDKTTDEFKICYQKDHDTTLHQIRGMLG